MNLSHEKLFSVKLVPAGLFGLLKKPVIVDAYGVEVFSVPERCAADADVICAVMNGAARIGYELGRLG